jgi:hypothetical protein
MRDPIEDDVPFDLSELGPAVGRDRLDALVQAAMRRGAPELARRRRGLAVVRLIVTWRRPLLAFSGLAAAAATVLFLRTGAAARPTSGQTVDDSATSSIAESLGVPSAFAQSVEGRSAVSVEAP